MSATSAWVAIVLKEDSVNFQEQESKSRWKGQKKGLGCYSGVHIWLSRLVTYTNIGGKVNLFPADIVEA